jgi:hypothetical protein
MRTDQYFNDILGRISTNEILVKYCADRLISITQGVILDANPN